ncbi:aldo/keto reductase [Carboxylicivirga sp. M1479]|uniref:aldo/keto reductase n=1 Tax=Carboxylicivirga sp. M1479 TaxID=2594476 RepID=UPI00163DA020|nr:aldo/keto reductase [Carboxylicivirga sp. M1479]
MTPKNISRRTFIKNSAIATSSLSLLPMISIEQLDPTLPLMTRDFGKLNHQVTTFGLGGQASIQWTPADVDPVAIIVKAFNLGVNYFDTSNLYGPSQLNFGKAFNKLGLIPGKAGYNEKLRKSIFLTSKTGLRYAKGDLQVPGLFNYSNGDDGSHAIDDVKRSLTQIFGDGKGYYPKGAYLDMVLAHTIAQQPDVDAIMEGYDNPDPKAERIGALAALLDYRDGTNTTGLNPKEEKLIKHIGFSGHHDTALMMQLIRRDHKNILDGMLVSINANDKLNFNMQHNVIPVAKASNMGVIGMKTFADGAMYTKEATWSNNPKHVVRSVGSSEVPYAPLIQYSLTTPGIDTLIIGIGQISDNIAHCQLANNIAASQITRDGLSAAQRLQIEEWAAKVKNGQTNYFQIKEGGLSAVHNIKLEKAKSNLLNLSWDTAYAGEHPIDKYLVYKNDELIGNIAHQPQISDKPFSFHVKVKADEQNNIQIVSLDKGGKKVASDVLKA